MNRKHLHAALLLAAASVVATEVYAQTTKPAPQDKAAAPDKDKAPKADKDKDSRDSKDSTDRSKTKTLEDRAARKAKEHDAQRAELSTLKATMNDDLKQELRRHAERLARLDRIKTVAQTEKDADSVDKATKLVAKENERHDKWMTKNVQPPAATAATPAVTPPPAAADVKGGAK